jgi:hypothetical protein
MKPKRNKDKRNTKGAQGKKQSSTYTQGWDKSVNMVMKDRSFMYLADSLLSI